MTITYNVPAPTITPIIPRLVGVDTLSDVIDFSTPILTSEYELVTASFSPATTGSIARASVAPVNAPLSFPGAVPYGLLTVGVNYLYNGDALDTLERQRSNQAIELLASAAVSSTVSSSDETNHNSKGAHFIIDVSAIASAGTITVSIQGKDSISGNYYDILVGSTITATGTTALKVYPGIGQIPNGSASDILPRTFRVTCTYGGSGTITYSVSCSLIV